MENRNKKITISELVEKKWQNKQFVVLQTSEGELSCWNTNLFGLLKAAKDEPLEVELVKTAKGKWVVNGIVGVESPKPAGKDKFTKAVERKEQSIKNFVDRKEASMTQQGIWRDAALFTAARLGTWKQAERKDFVEEYAMWQKFLEDERKPKKNQK